MLEYTNRPNSQIFVSAMTKSSLELLRHPFLGFELQDINFITKCDQTVNFTERVRFSRPK